MAKSLETQANALLGIRHPTPKEQMKQEKIARRSDYRYHPERVASTCRKIDKCRPEPAPPGYQSPAQRRALRALIASLDG